jgi:hypothetical protein
MLRPCPGRNGPALQSAIRPLGWYSGVRADLAFAQAAYALSTLRFVRIRESPTSEFTTCGIGNAMSTRSSRAQGPSSWF